MTSPVLIVGAGPVGLTMAMALKRRGVDVRIVEKAAAPTDKSKALAIWPRTLELLEIEGCVAPFLEAGLKTVGARILAQHGTLLMHVPFSSARSVYNFALVLPQSDTERLLDAQLTQLGVHVERCVELVSFSEGDGEIQVVLRHGDGREEITKAAYLAACDGAHSTVRHGLGFEFEGNTLSSDYLLADVEIEGDLPNDELAICWAPDGILALFPIKGRRFRVIGDLGPAAADAAGLPASSTLPAQPAPPTLADVQAILDDRGPPGLRAQNPVWLTHFHINERKVKEYRRGRVFLAGDAAHIHSPAGGQGMNTGMQDAFNLAWKLAMVWHGQAGAGLLDSYSPERSAIGEQVLRNAGNLTRVALLRNPVVQEIRRLAVGALGRVPALRQHMVDQLTEVDLHYPDSPLTDRSHGAAAHPAPGDRAPDIRPVRPVPGEGGNRDGNGNAKGAASLYEALSDGKFAVMSVGAAAVSLPPGLLQVASVLQAESAPGYDPGYIYIVRPDAYVAASCKADDGASDQIMGEMLSKLIFSV